MADLTKRRSMKLMFTTTVISMVTLLSCAVRENPQKYMTSSLTAPSSEETTLRTDTATFGTGCFWCTEAIFQQLEGVLKVSSGYSGGHVKIQLIKKFAKALLAMPNV